MVVVMVVEVLLAVVSYCFSFFVVDYGVAKFTL